MHSAWWLRAALAALVGLQTVAACPCMDGLPAMGHNPTGELYPVRIPPRDGCQSSPGGAPVGDGSQRVVLLETGFQTNPFDAWRTLPTDWYSGLTWRYGALVADMVPVDGLKGLYDPTVRADGSDWSARATFRMGSAAQGQPDANGTGAWQFRFMAIAPDEGSMHELPGLDVLIEKTEAGGYGVTGPEGRLGLFVSDTQPHEVEVRQSEGEVTVSLDGKVVARRQPLTAPEECLLVGLSASRHETTLGVRLTAFQLASLPNLAARQLLEYGMYAPPPLPANGTAPACSTPENACCLVEPISESYGAYPCTVRCVTTTGPFAAALPNDAVDPDDDFPVVHEAMRAVGQVLGCKPDPQGQAFSATLWTAGPGRNEADPADWPARGIRYTATDTVMYDEQGKTRFGCQLMGGRILVQLEYGRDELALAGLAEEDLRILHWDGRALRPLEPGKELETALGRLTVEGIGIDTTNRTAWGLVRIEQDVDGRSLNNNFATVKLSQGRVLGNGYLLGSADAKPYKVPPATTESSSSSAGSPSTSGSTSLQASAPGVALVAIAAAAAAWRLRPR